MWKSLTFRIWLPFTLSVFMMASVIAFYYPESQKDMMIANKKTQLANIAKTVALGVELNFTIGDETKSLEGIQKTLEWAGREDDVDYIAIEVDEENGKKDIFLERFFSDTISGLSENNEEYVFGDADFNTEVFKGRILVSASSKQVNNQVWDLNKKVYLFLAVIFFVISLAFYFLARFLSSPLKMLRRTTNALINKQYKTQVITSRFSSVEVSALATSISALRDAQIKEKNNNEQILANLEQLVEKRSQSLKEAQQVAKLASFEWDTESDKIYGVNEFFDNYTNRKICNRVQTGEAFYSTVHPKSVNEIRSALLNLLEVGGEKVVEYKLHTTEKRSQFIELHARIKRENDSVMLFGTIRDKTSQVESELLKENFTKELEQEIKKKTEDLLNSENELYYRMDTLNQVAMVSEFNTEGIITYSNEHFCKVLGFNESDIVGSTFTDLISTSQEEDVSAGIWEEIKSGKTWRGELVVKTEQNKDVWLIVSVVPFFKVSREIDKYVVVSFDITDEKDLQHQLELSLNKERGLSDLKSHFISMASHQFRTPLSIIQSNSELLNMVIQKESESTLKENLLRSSERITSEISRMTQLMDDVLILGKIGSSYLQPNPKEVDLVLMLSDIKDQSDIIYPEGRHLKLEIVGEKKTAFLDEKLIRHVFENLISNAFKYSQESNPFVVLTFESDRIVVSVEDKGIGIPEADVEKLFQPFYRAENVGPAPGTGLGLAIAKEYVELNGGSIHLQSVENKGTTVTVELPLQLIDHYEHKPISTEVHLEN